MTQVQLFSAIALSACAAIISQIVDDQSMIFTVLKPFTTILIILAFVLYKTLQKPLSNFVLIALVACLCGDIFLLNDEQFAFGLSSFLLAHLLFTYVFLKLAENQFNFAPLVLLLIFASCFYVLIFPNLGELAIPVAVYQICISIMCWLAINLWLVRRDHLSLCLCLASLLFVFSDSVIAIDKFLVPFKLSGLVILTSYWVSITMIVYGFTLPDLVRDSENFRKSQS